MVIRCKEIPFFDHLIGENGARPDPVNVQAIADMPEPGNVNELQTFLGMSNYLSRFTLKTFILEYTITWFVQETFRISVGTSTSQGLYWRQGRNLKSLKSTVLRQQEAVDPASRRVHSRSRSCIDPRQRTSGLCEQSSDGDWREILESRARDGRYNLRAGKIPSLCVWSTCFDRNRPQTALIYFTEESTRPSTASCTYAVACTTL